MSEKSPLLELRNIKKRFGGIHALKGVSLSLYKGECLALAGENGAGKSTLIKILAGIYHADEGEMAINGRKREFHDPHDSHLAGISVINQELSLAPHLTVAENIFIGGLHNRAGFLLKRKLHTEARKILTRLGVDIETEALVKNLSIAEKQFVEIAKALTFQAKVLILDEPTAVLASTDVKRLFTLLSSMKKEGVSLIYITHRLEELFEIADRVQVLKDGETSTLFNDRQQITKEKIVEAMVGRHLEELFPDKLPGSNKPLLSIKNLGDKEAFHNVSFDLFEGEILGIGGLVGSGRSELVTAIAGINPYSEGSITLTGERATEQELIKKIALVPENRKEEGLFIDLPLFFNTTFSSLNKISTKKGLLSKRKEEQLAAPVLKKLKTKYSSARQQVGQLSGGNQQKVVIGKALLSDPKVVIFDEPTRGIDVGAKLEIYTILKELAESGIGILIVSSDMLELIGLCNRVVVLNRGVVKGNLTKEEITEQQLMHLYLD